MAQATKARKPVLALAAAPPFDVASNIGAAPPFDVASNIEEERLKRLTGYNVTRANLRTLRAFAAHVGKVGLTPAEFSVMVLIDANQGINQKQLGGALDISAPNLAVMLDQLSTRGLLTRVRGAVDRRLQHPQLTAAGTRLLANAEVLATGMEQRVLDVLSVDERATLIALLQKIAR